MGYVRLVGYRKHTNTHTHTHTHRKQTYRSDYRVASATKNENNANLARLGLQSGDIDLTFLIIH